MPLIIPVIYISHTLELIVVNANEYGGLIRLLALSMQSKIYFQSSGKCQLILNLNNTPDYMIKLLCV